ncbi:UDP-2,3-diacylglucosamine diphosphatase LpxI domain-containing protein [Maritalea porphyrae]|uniref:LpxI C-terminal domain-containing protein n=1 Tax=Maritalea porphyrae TaxID=880732 RepID=A0ABQ5UV99_9HYPH|nr:UDP-2,3-diacylglucosamine diphosphatase LpxI [Maritalea porphyrae]GLQ18488.1 hypothetical protein GCM10007879_27370 [Maritalea porphyrae]
MTKLALLVGRGDLANAAQQAIKAHYDGAYCVWSMVGESADETKNIDVGQPLELIDRLRADGITTLCAVGNVDLSPQLRANVGKYLVEHYQGKLDVSDMGLETAYRTIAKDARVDIKGIHELIPELLALTGDIAGPSIAAKASDVEQLIRVARSIARTDLGQSVVFHATRPIAAEDALGTDSLLSRAKEIADRIRITKGEMVLVKVAKPQQSGLGDLPTIGPRTIEMCADAGIGAIVVEGGKCLIAEREMFSKMAEEHKISVVGWG